MIQENLAAVQKNIVTACERRSSDIKGDVLLVAVTKNHDIHAMREAIDYEAQPVTDIGENRIQEAKGKSETLDRNVVWHLIGHLQTNKAKQAVKLFDLIHSVDSLHLAEALNNAAAGIDKVQNVLVQVNLAKEDSKSGIYEEELEELLHKVDEMENLHLQGLMLIAPNYEDVEECRPLFKKMYQIFQQAKAWSLNNSEMKYLSMGMTHDYQIAIEEGANIVRVGTAIFGQRQY